MVVLCAVSAVCCGVYTLLLVMCVKLWCVHFIVSDVCCGVYTVLYVICAVVCAL